MERNLKKAELQINPYFNLVNHRYYPPLGPVILFFMKPGWVKKKILDLEEIQEKWTLPFADWKALICSLVHVIFSSPGISVKEESLFILLNTENIILDPLPTAECQNWN